MSKNDKQQYINLCLVIRTLAHELLFVGSPRLTSYMGIPYVSICITISYRSGSVTNLGSNTIPSRLLHDYLAKAFKQNHLSLL